MAEKSPVIVGYALREKRIKSFFIPSLFEKAKEENVEFVKVDPERPLVQQGPFDLLLHKLEGDDWARQLDEYEAAHPETVIVDKYANVHLLDDRLEMLKVVTGLDVGVAVEAPRQISIPLGTPQESIPQIVADSGLQLPFVSKPEAANGTVNAHQLCLVITKAALAHIEPPVVLQEFKNHGGVLFKLYLLGDKVMVFKRQSLPDIPSEAVEEGYGRSGSGEEEKGGAEGEGEGEGEGEELQTPDETMHHSDSIGAMIRKGAGLVEFNRISNVHMSEEEMNDGRVVDPPPALMQTLGLELRKRLGLQTFNVDVLRDEGHKDRYYVVDINYMPGYERLPDFEEMFLDFVRKLVERRRLKMSLTAAERVAAKEEGTAKARPAPPALPYPALSKSKKWTHVKAALKLASLSRGASLEGGPPPAAEESE